MYTNTNQPTCIEDLFTLVMEGETTSKVDESQAMPGEGKNGREQVRMRKSLTLEIFTLTTVLFGLYMSLRHGPYAASRIDANLL